MTACIAKRTAAAGRPGKSKVFTTIFKAYPGGYGEGDRFIGVKVPDQRQVAKKYYQQLSLTEVKELLQEPIHEYRQTALFMLTEKYKRAEDEAAAEKIVRLYLENTAYINNWDLVDCSADKILGAYFFTRSKETLYRLARSNNLWEQRIAIMATFYFIKQGF